MAKKEVFNNRIKEETMEKTLDCFSREYLIKLLIYNGCVENTVNKIIKDYAPEGFIYHSIKDILK